MIELVMNFLRTTTYGIIAFVIIYVILKILANRQEYKNGSETNLKPRPTQIEIVSKDLYVKAENLIETHEVYSMQARQLQIEIEEVEHKLYEEKHSPIKSDIEVKLLISQSLKLQEKKCNLESKMLKINEQLDKIAKEEYRRQTTGDN